MAQLDGKGMGAKRCQQRNDHTFERRKVRVLAGVYRWLDTRVRDMLILTHSRLPRVFPTSNTL